MINICSPCWWTDMWWWSWGIQIFPNIGGHIAPGISDWTFWGSPLPVYISPRAALSSSVLHHSQILSMKLKTVNEYVWLISSEVGSNDDGSSLLVIGFAFVLVRFAYFALLRIWVDCFAICTLMIKHTQKWIPERLNISVFANVSTRIRRLRAHKEPPSHPVGSLHPRQPPIIKTSLSNSIWTLCLKIFAQIIETLSIFALLLQHLYLNTGI